MMSPSTRGVDFQFVTVGPRHSDAVPCYSTLAGRVGRIASLWGKLGATGGRVMALAACGD